MIDLREQVLILIYSFLSGIILGFCFDIYKVLLIVINKKFIKFTLILTFWIFTGGAIFYFLLSTQHAVLSFYTYFYIFAGTVFYLRLISKINFNILSALVQFAIVYTRVMFRNIYYIFSKILVKKLNKHIEKN